MTIYSSKDEKGFFDSNLHTPEQIPTDAVVITQDYYVELLSGSENNKVIDFSVVPPVLVDPVKVWPTASQLSANIDDKVAGIYANWARFKAEYQAREAAAQAFKDAGYEGDAGAWIKSYAVPAGLTDAEAADRILAQAEAKRAAQVRLAELRMYKLELVALGDEERFARYEQIMAEIGEVESGVAGA